MAGLEDDGFEGTDDSLQYPPGKDLTVSNFFDTDEKIAVGVDVLDTEAMDHVMKQWRAEAHKMMKKKGGNKEVEEVKPEEMAVRIGGTVLTERRGAISGRDQIKKGKDEASSKSLKETPRNRFVTSPPSIGQAMPQVAMQQSAPSSIWVVPSIKETIDRILVDQPFVLEWYRTLDEKKGLLKEAISTHDGNTIITIVLFLRSTLSKTMFEALLLSHIEAAHHYCSFLRQNTAWEQLKSVYYVLGEERYAMLQYQLAHSQESINTRINAVEKCVMLLKDKTSLKKEQYFMEEYWNLLKRQIKMEEVRKALPASAVHRFQSTPLIDSTLVTSLMYCCRFHLNDENPLVNAEAFKKDFKVSEKQYFIVLLGSLCARRDWTSIDTLLTPKSFSSKLGFGSKIKAPISLERIIRIVGKRTYLAEEDFLAKYIKQIDDPELRLEFATKYQCYSVGIEVLKSLKDIERLRAYFDQIPVERQRKYRPLIIKLLS